MNPRTPPPTVLVTGATGFAGGRLALELVRRGHRVRALVRPGSRSEHLHSAGIELIEGQLTSAADVDRAVAGMDAIYHIAAAYRTAKQPDSFYHDVNVGGTQHVIDSAVRHGVSRVVHCSTVGVHGHVSPSPGDEDSPFNPGDIYQQTKLDGETRVRDAMDRGLSAAIVRPGAIYGPGDLRLLKLFRGVQNGTFRIFGDGRVHYHLVYVDDLVEGFILCGTSPAAVGQAFIIAGPEHLALNELVELVADAVGVRPPRMRLPLRPLLAAADVCEALCRPLGVEPPLHRRRAEFFVKNRAFSTEKARRLIGYAPRTTARDGLLRTAQWYASRGLLKPVPSREHARQQVLQEAAS